MCLTDEELEQFDEDPVEYCRAHFGGKLECDSQECVLSAYLTTLLLATDFIEDWFSSPITAAISFIQVLTKARKQATLIPMLNVVNTMVSE